MDLLLLYGLVSGALLMALAVVYGRRLSATDARSVRFLSVSGLLIVATAFWVLAAAHVAIRTHRLTVVRVLLPAGYALAAAGVLALLGGVLAYCVWKGARR